MSDYARPEVLVSTDWVAKHLADTERVRVIESNEDVLLYATGHLHNAVHVDWQTDLQDPDVRDYISQKQFEALCSRLGMRRDTTAVFYGDKSNWWATYAFWTFKMFGHGGLPRHGRRPGQVDGRGADAHDRRPRVREHGLHGREAAAQGPRVPRRGLAAHGAGRPARRRPLAAGVYRRGHARAGQPELGGGPPRRPHPGGLERPVEPGRKLGRDVQEPGGPGGHLPRGAGAPPEGPRRSPTAGSASARATPGSS